jgi:hypothetical protein
MKKVIINKAGLLAGLRWRTPHLGQISACLWIMALQVEHIFSFSSRGVVAGGA